MTHQVYLSPAQIKAQIEDRALRMAVLPPASADPADLERWAFPFLNAELPGYRHAAGELWQHSLACARLARRLAQMLGLAGDSHQAYLAGLLHDIGKPLLDVHITGEYPRLVERMWKRKLQLWQVEEQLFGLHHAAAGALVAARLGLPPACVDAIRCHHHPTPHCAGPKLAALLHIADALTPTTGWGLAALGGRAIHPEALHLLELDMPALERLRRQLALPAL